MPGRMHFNRRAIGDVELDIVIPVYNEGENIVGVLESLRRSVKTRFRVLICYDHEEDTTLAALSDYRSRDFSVSLVKNDRPGALGAVVSGFRSSSAPAVLVFPADDDYNAPRLDRLVEEFRKGCDIVVASRFMPGGCMQGAPLLKSALIHAGAIVLRHVGRLPVRDPSNGLRLFSRKVLERLPVESTAGFAYSLELLVKCHRLGWKIGEAPVAWYERKRGQSRFKVLAWLPQYLVWVRYALATTLLGRGPETVVQSPPPAVENKRMCA